MQTTDQQKVKWVVSEEDVKQRFLLEAKRRGIDVTIQPNKKRWTLPANWKRLVGWGLAIDALIGLIIMIGWTLLGGPKADNMGRNNPNHQRSVPITLERPQVANNMGANNPLHRRGQRVAIVLPAPTQVATNPIPQPANVVIPATVGQPFANQPRMALSVAQQLGANGGAPVDNTVMYQEPQQQQWQGGGYQEPQQWNGGYQQPQNQQWSGGRQRQPQQRWAGGNDNQRCFGCEVQYQPERSWGGWGAYQAKPNINVYNPQMTYQQIQPAGVQPQYQHYAPMKVGPLTIQPPPRLQTVVGGVYRTGSPLSCPGALGLLGGIFGTCSGGGLVQLQPNGQYLPVR